MKFLLQKEYPHSWEAQKLFTLRVVKAVNTVLKLGLPMGWMGWTKRIRTLRYARKIRAFLGRASVWKVSSCFSKTGEKHVLQNHCKAKNLQTPYQDLPKETHGDFYPILKETKLGLRIIQLNTFNCGEGPHQSIEGHIWNKCSWKSSWWFQSIGNNLETYCIVSQIGSFPDIGAKIKNIGTFGNHHLGVPTFNMLSWKQDNTITYPPWN